MAAQSQIGVPLILKSIETTKRFLPISRYQRALVRVAEETEATSFFNREKTIRWAFRVTPGLSHRRLRHAFEELVARHDSLRLRFVQTGQVWQAEILDAHPQGLVVEDLTHLSPSEQDATIQKRASEPVTALSDTLFQIHLLQCGIGGDVILCRMTHAIGDGYSVAVLIEDLLKFLMRMPPQNKAMSHAQFMLHRQKRLAERANEKEQFWQDRLLPLPEDLSIGRKQQGLERISMHTMGKTRRLDDVLGPEMAAQLDTLAKTAGISSYCYLYAAFCETLCKLGDAPEIMVKSPVSRHDAGVADFVGADVQVVMAKYRSAPGALGRQAAWVSDQIAQGVANLPTEAFDPGSVIERSFHRADISASRFLVHVEVPSGRLKASPFRTLFQKGLSEKISLGPVSIERVALPQDIETNFELILLLDHSGDTPTAALIANAESYSKGDLVEIAQGIRGQFSGIL